MNNSWSKVKKQHIFKDGIEYKECGHCKEVKLLTEFHKCKIKADGYSNTCKTCMLIYKPHVLVRKKMTDETRQRMSKAHMGMKHTEEEKRKISEGNRGKVVSAETGVKISYAKRGIPMTEVVKKKISKTLKGRKFSKEHLINLRKDAEKRKKQHIFKDGREYKQCSRCKEIKEIFNFGNCKSNGDKLACICKQCSAQKSKEYLKNNKDEIHIRHKKYYEKNKKEIMRKAGIRNKKRRKTNVNYRLRMIVSCRILDALKNNRKSAHTAELVGLSMEEYRQYLESLFDEEKNWKAFLDGELELHHIEPCENFNFENEEEQFECFNFSNTILLWVKEHDEVHAWLYVHPEESREEYKKLMEAA